jgi:hypothetical protein
MNNPEILELFNKKFISKFIILLGIIFILDFSIGKILSYYYFKQDSGLQYRTTYSMEKTTADVLIFGSSRANHHYYPKVFEDSLGMSYYNAGRDGNYIFYHCAVLRSVLKRYSPKLVFLDFKKDELDNSQDSYERLSSLLPYYKTHPETRSIVQLKSPYEKIKLLSAIYPYNSSIFTIAVGNTEFNKKRMADDRGYMPLTKVWDGLQKPGNNQTTDAVDTVKMTYYESFVKDCADKKIKLYVVVSPYFNDDKKISNSLTIGKKIAQKYGVSFLDYSKDSSYINHNSLFSDPDHLNDEGAKLFSGRLMADIHK